MHNIKDIRNNIESFKSSLKNRKTNINFNELLDLDQKNRKIIHSENPPVKGGYLHYETRLW